ncbi:MAG: hypothetical protein IKZ82_00990 [Clostridia bacterium]|nr:hypothetical protein [Clostridia bacterium]
MNKTKLGISTHLLAAILYLLGLFGNTVALVIAAGYVLIREDDEWLRKSAIKALVIHVFITALTYVIAFIPGVFEAINSFINIFKGSFNYSFLLRIREFLDDALIVVRYAVFIVLAFLALKGKGVALPGVDDTVQKHS